MNRLPRTWVLPIQGRADFCYRCPRASLRFALGYHLRPPWGKNYNKTQRRPPSIGSAHIYSQLTPLNFLEPPARLARDSPSNNYSMCTSQTRDRGTYHRTVRLRLTVKRFWRTDPRIGRTYAVEKLRRCVVDSNLYALSVCR